MTGVQQTVPGAIDERQRERLLKMMAVATFIIFFQAYMVAPIIPALSNAFGTPVETVGLIVPAYLIPYGISTLAYGLLADRARVRAALPGMSRVSVEPVLPVDVIGIFILVPAGI
jgi:predicted MFS family arabinose efflux permease